MALLTALQVHARGPNIVYIMADELGRQTAVRMQHWKAIRPGAKAEWELYNLQDDIEEKVSVAEQNPEVLAKMTAFAKAAHEPVEEGVLHDRAIHERDRRAKYGFEKGARAVSRRNPNANRLPTDGLIPRKKYKLMRVSSESRSNFKTGTCAFEKVAVKKELARSKKSQEVTCAAVTGRYVMLRALSEINGGPWASAAEFGVLGE